MSKSELNRTDILSIAIQRMKPCPSACTVAAVGHLLLHPLLHIGLEVAALGGLQQAAEAQALRGDRHVLRERRGSRVGGQGRHLQRKGLLEGHMSCNRDDI